MIYNTESEAIVYISNTIAKNRVPYILVQIMAPPKNSGDFLNKIFQTRPELIACVEAISMRSDNIGSCFQLALNVTYTESMPSTIDIIERTDLLPDILYRDVELHRRFSEIVLPSELENDIVNSISRLTETPRFLDCFMNGTSITTKKRPGCNYIVIRVQYSYSCGFTEYRSRKLQMNNVINEIIKLSKTSGLEDWKRALAVVKYCVANWRYGSLPKYPDLEYTSYGALVHHTAVCMGISLAICAVFSKLGIPCRYIRGSREGGGHAWNLVFLRGGWFFIDVTDAISHGDPLFHWGMTSYYDRSSIDPIEVALKCNCSEAFMRMHEAE